MRNKPTSQEEKIECFGCKKIMDYFIFTDIDGAFIVPTFYAKTIQQLGKIYLKEMGARYYDDTGVRISEAFEKKTMPLSHEDFEDFEAMEHHTFGEFECWTDNP
jgi:hypothetical protein